MTFDTVTLLTAVALSSVISWGVVQIFKSFLNAWLNHTTADDKSPWWWNSSLRVFAVFVGAAVGSFIIKGNIGLLIGASAGILNTAVVAVIKSKLRKFKIHADDEG